MSVFYFLSPELCLVIISTVCLQICLKAVNKEKAPAVPLAMEFIWLLSLVGVGGAAMCSCTGCADAQAVQLQVVHTGSIQRDANVSKPPAPAYAVYSLHSLLYGPRSRLLRPTSLINIPPKDTELETTVLGSTGLSLVKTIL